MTSTKVPPPRKLTENEDNDSFDDFWFQVICYYSRDEAFKPIFEDSTYKWQSSKVTNRGLSDATKAANLNTLLRALATYAAGPYIRNNIIENTTCLQDVRKEFMKYLEIELTDFTALEWFEVTRRPTERPLVFYMRLKYHMSKHLLKTGDDFQGTRLTSDEQLSPSMQRFIVMEWLNRLDTRLVKYVKEKFSTELSAGSNVLVNMVETLARNVDHYITILNNPGDVSAVSFSNPSSQSLETASYDHPLVAYQSSRSNQRRYQSRFQARNRGFGARGFPPGRGGFSSGRGDRGRGVNNQRNQTDCVYCYMEYRNGNANDYRHPITSCPVLSNMYGSVNLLENCEEDELHPFEDTLINFSVDTEEDAYSQQ